MENFVVLQTCSFFWKKIKIEFDLRQNFQGKTFEYIKSIPSNNGNTKMVVVYVKL